MSVPDVEVEGCSKCPFRRRGPRWAFVEDWACSLTGKPIPDYQGKVEKSCPLLKSGVLVQLSPNARPA